MSTDVVSILLTGTIAGLLIFALRYAATRPKSLYERRPRLFTPAERVFLGALDRAVGGQYRVMGKVRIADVLRPREGLMEREWKRAFYRISSKHVDFLLCDKETLEPVCAIELDDASHGRLETIDRDALVNGAFRDAGLPLLRVPVQRDYSGEEMRARIEEVMRGD